MGSAYHVLLQRLLWQLVVVVQWALCPVLVRCLLQILRCPPQATHEVGQPLLRLLRLGPQGAQSLSQHILERRLYSCCSNSSSRLVHCGGNDRTTKLVRGVLGVFLQRCIKVHFFAAWVCAMSTTKRSPSEFLKSVLGRPVIVKLNSGVDYRGALVQRAESGRGVVTLRCAAAEYPTGVLACLDGYMNIAMEQTEEYENGRLKNKYGDCFIRGNNGALCSWHAWSTCMREDGN